MKSYIIIPVILLLITSFTLAESLKGKKIQKQPIRYNTPLVNDQYEVDIPDFNRRDAKPWIVWSDRDENITYKSPRVGAQMAKLQFMESFYVYEESEDGNYLHIVSDPNPDKKDRKEWKFSSQSRDMGWINTDNLLLWKRCLKTDAGRIDMKGMILNTVSSIESTLKDEEAKPDIVSFKKGPIHDAYEDTGYESRLYNFFFIFKITDTAVLLGKEIRISGSIEELKEVMVGWAPLDRCTIWSSRVALEPNWKRDAVTERKDGAKARLFESMQDAESYRSGDASVFGLWNQDPLVTTRETGEKRRFPVLALNRKNPDLVEVGVMGEIFFYEDDGGMRRNDPIDPARFAKLQQKLQRLKEQLRHIKICFVVDGTKSMGPYFGAISNAIFESTLKLELRGTEKNQFEFATVIYRDYSEGRRALEIRDFGSDERIEDFLDESKARDFQDTDTPENVYNGINAALERTDFGPQSTNVVVVVGDAGNHMPDQRKLTPESISRKLVDKNVHFLAFQVHHASHPSYGQFPGQMNQIKSSADRLYSSRLAAETSRQLSSPYMARVYEMGSGRTLAPEDLQAKLQEFVFQMNKNTYALVAELEKLIDGDELVVAQPVSFRPRTNTGQSEYDNTHQLSTLVNDIVMRNLSEDDIYLLRNRKFQLYLDGSGTMNVVNQRHPLFNRVLLYSQEGLGALRTDIGRLIDASGPNQRRESLYDTWLDILKHYLGGDLGEKEVAAQADNWTFEEINRKVFGLPGTTSFLKDVKLKRLKLKPNEGGLEDEEILEWSERFEKTLIEITRMLQSKDVIYSFEANNSRFYWVDEKIFP